MHHEALPLRVAVLIPCWNEESTIGDVVTDFRTALPSAEIYVFDNNSTDQSVARASSAHACVLLEPRQGKGFVLQAMFQRVDADVYVLVDGDRTYGADAVRSLIEPVLCGRADMVVGSRLHPAAKGGFSTPHLWGNRFFVLLSRVLFGIGSTDMLSGYRVLTRRLARSVNLTSGGFQVETELTIKAIRDGFRVIDIPVALVRRPAGSHSKIRPLRDGWAITAEMLALFRRDRPLTFITGIGVALLLSTAVASLTRPAIVQIAVMLTSILFLSMVMRTIVRRT
jgi:glycosyltransferase involved in cell wall biosynthesis